MEIYKKRHLWKLAPALLQRLGDRDPIFKCQLIQTVNSFVCVEFSQAGTLKGAGSPQGHSLELLEMMLEFVQVSLVGW